MASFHEQDFFVMTNAISQEDQKAKAFLKEYLETISPTGHEIAGQKVWAKYVSAYMGEKDEFLMDDYGGLVAVIKGSNSDYKVVLDAHADEISWRVKLIEESGLIGVTKNGGSDALVAAGSVVNIQSSKGQLTGIFGSPAVHVRGDSDKKEPKDDELRVDVGAESKSEVLEMGIDIGMTMTYATTFGELNNKYIYGRALDDRICGYIDAQIIRQLKEQNIVLPYDLCVVNSVQEETGLHGASWMANKLKPNLAIVLDVGHDTTTRGYNKSKQGDLACGKGPIVPHGAVLHNKVVDYIVNTAVKNKVPIQKAAIERSSGTNADSYAYEGEGCPTGLIKLPLKYMHTAVETVSKKDIGSLTSLLMETLKGIEGKESQFTFANEQDEINRLLKNKPA